MTLIVNFLEARLAEDEQMARAASARSGDWRSDGEGVRGGGEPYTVDWDDGPDYVEYAHDHTIVYNEGWPLAAEAHHIARFNPARVLREVAIKRDILDVDRPGFGKDGVICNGHPGPFMNHGDYGPGYCAEPDEFSSWYKLAWAYKDHPDYQPEWLDRTPRYDR